jgi:hypothetical protein
MYAGDYPLPGRRLRRSLPRGRATPEGKKELIGFKLGLRESAQSWDELLTDIKGRGLSVPPKIAVGPSRDICCANALQGNGRCHGLLECSRQGFSKHKKPTVLGP